MIQRNAITSWNQLCPRCEIILCGDDPTVAATGLELQTKHLPLIDSNEFGTPLVSSAFELVQQAATLPLVCYINSDIILLDDFLPAVCRIPFRRFLMIGRRWDVPIEGPLDFSSEDWTQRVRACVKRRGTIHPPLGSDFFVFPKGILGPLPPFAVGRPGWDNWLIFHARLLGIPVVDATRAATVVHQNHDYRHVPHGVGHNSYDGPEARRNLELVGSSGYVFTNADATHILTDRLLLPSWQPAALRRRLRSWPILLIAKLPFGRYRAQSKRRPES